MQGGAEEAQECACTWAATAGAMPLMLGSTAPSSSSARDASLGARPIRSLSSACALPGSASSAPSPRHRPASHANGVCVHVLHHMDGAPSSSAVMPDRAKCL